MANVSNSMTENERELLSKASVEACYVATLLKVIEDTFEDIDSFCDKLPENYAAGWIRSKARIGLDVTYMTQDKSSLIKALANQAEEQLAGFPPQQQQAA